MKRLILCQHCEKKQRKLFSVKSPYPGEHVKFVNGASLVDCSCDDCNHNIRVAEKVCALSMWKDYGGVPYFSWEGEYMQVATESVESPVNSR